jgi:hypothetical protein
MPRQDKRPRGQRSSKKPSQVVLTGHTFCNVFIPVMRRDMLLELSYIKLHAENDRNFQVPTRYRRYRRLVEIMIRAWMTGVPRTYTWREPFTLPDRLRQDVKTTVDSKPCAETLLKLVLRQDKNVRIKRQQKAREKYRSSSQDG